MEAIKRVEVLDNDQLIVVLASGGKPDYQYVYREACEIYWDNDLKAFKSPVPRSWSHSDWFHQIVSVAKKIGVNLTLNSQTSWVNIPNNVKEQILVGKNT